MLDRITHLQPTMGVPPLPLPQLSQPRDCHRSVGEPRMSLSVPPPPAPLIQHWLGPCSLDGFQHGFPPPSPPRPSGHFCRSPSPARRTRSSQSSCKSFPAAQGSAKLSLPPKFMEKQVPASDAQHNCEVEQAVLASCSKGSCSLSLPLPQPVTLGGQGQAHPCTDKAASAQFASPHGTPQAEPPGSTPNLGQEQENPLWTAEPNTPVCLPFPLCPQCWQGREWERMKGSGRETRARG